MMLINLTLLHISTSNLLPSPYLTGKISRCIIQSSRLNHFYSHFLFFQEPKQVSLQSTYFNDFLQAPIQFNGDILLACAILNHSISFDSSTIIQNCIFSECAEIISSNAQFQNFQVLNTQFVDSGCDESGIVLRCNSILFSSVEFSNCKFQSLIQIEQCNSATFQYITMKQCSCETFFNVSSSIEYTSFSYMNFIQLEGLLFYFPLQSITLTKCYFNCPSANFSLTEIKSAPSENSYCNLIVNDCIYISTPACSVDGTFSSSGPTYSFVVLQMGYCPNNFKPMPSPYGMPPLIPTITPIQTPTPSDSATPRPTQEPKPKKDSKKTLIIVLVVIFVILFLAIMAIVIWKCVRKLKHMMSDEDYDKGVMIRFDTENNESETTSNRSDALEFHSDDIESDREINAADYEFADGVRKPRNPYYKGFEFNVDDADSSSL